MLEYSGRSLCRGDDDQVTGVGNGSSQSMQDGMIKEVVSTEPPTDEQMDFVIRVIAQTSRWISLSG